MSVYLIGSAVEFPWHASPRHQDLTAKEWERGGRVIGGDKGDVHFEGYDVLEDGTELRNVTLVSSLDLTPEEAYEITYSVIEEAYASIGAECVEHN